MTLQMLKVHPEGVIGVSNTADTLAVVVVKGSVTGLKVCVIPHVEKQTTRMTTIQKFPFEN